MRKIILAALAVLTITGAQAKTAVNTYVYKTYGDTTRITIYSNKTATVKFSGEDGTDTSRAKWHKGDGGIVIDSRTEEPGHGGWKILGVLKSSKRGTVMYNPEYYGNKSPRCTVIKHKKTRKAKKARKAKRSKQYKRRVINAGRGYDHFPATKYVCNGFRNNPNEVYRLHRNGSYTVNGKRAGTWIDNGDQALLYGRGAPISPNSWDVKLTHTDKGIYRRIEGVPRYRGRCYLN